jgi:hypothetical protein
MMPPARRGHDPREHQLVAAANVIFRGKKENKMRPSNKRKVSIPIASLAIGLSAEDLIACGIAGLFALMFAATAAHASLEPNAQTTEINPQLVALACDQGLTRNQSRACEAGADRWRFCQQVYQSRFASDEAFYACFYGAK